MTDWREERHIARYSTDELFKDVIDTALPDDSSDEYMLDFYEESDFSEEWMNTSEHVKKFMLDAEIEQYMQDFNQ